MAGEAQLALGLRAEARSTFLRAVARDPLKWELWFDLAVASDGRARARAAAHAERLNPRSPRSRPHGQSLAWSLRDEEVRSTHSPTSILLSATSMPMSHIASRTLPKPKT